MVAKKVQAVIYDIKKGVPYFLILHRVLHWRGWELHKGTIENNDSYKKTLRREIFEETGLKNVRIVKPLGISFYFNRRKSKVVEVFLVKASMRQKINVSRNPDREHDGYLWADRETALKKLTYSNAKKIISELRL
ncbi:MAG: NUDIX domain-containing protein [Candidatus Nanoarchaeia archaeon]